MALASASMACAPPSNCTATWLVALSCQIGFVFCIELDPDAAEDALARLREHRKVRLAERLDARARP